MNRTTAVRGLLATVVVCLVVALLAQSILAGAAPNAVYERRAGSSDQPQSVGERSTITVVTTQTSDARDASGELVAFAPNGSVLFHTDNRSTYWDVDPVANTTASVTYVATVVPNASACGTDGVLGPNVPCHRNVIERLNLTTGERTRLYTHRAENGRWHDVDRINATHYLVGDIGADAVSIIDVSSGIREWTWSVESDYPITSGGAYVEDWSHVNDVEYLHDGRIMVDLRNQDRVVFLNRSGPIEGWTLGDEDDYDVLREQHNPDYIPRSAGGPGVLVADSENDRIVEYQRTNESGDNTDDDSDKSAGWKRSWTWRDDRLQWPRDADRLPNGHTLITDTIGDRVFEVNASGDVVWSVHIDRPYEAERLATGAESTNGPSATRADIASRSIDTEERSAAGVVEAWIRGATPPVVENGLLGYFFPWWMGFWAVLAVFVLAAVAVCWAILELHWADVSVRLALPIGVEGANPVWSVLALLVLLGLVYAGTVVVDLL